MRKRRQIGRAKRAQRRHHGMQAGIQRRDKPFEYTRRNAGAARRHAGDPHRHHRAHRLVRQSRSEADRMAERNPPLIGDQILFAERRVHGGAQRRGQPIDRTVLRRMALHHGAAARRSVHEFQARLRPVNGGGQCWRCPPPGAAPRSVGRASLSWIAFTGRETPFTSHVSGRQGKNRVRQPSGFAGGE